MSASNTAHVPMDEPHLSRYGANAARALELEGAVRPGTVAREMRRALAEVERARQELARWAEESGARRERWSGCWTTPIWRRGRGGWRSGPSAGAGPCDAAGTASLFSSVPPGRRFGRSPTWTAAALTVFLSAFQSVLPLTERELSLLVPALTWALLCQLRGLCGDLAALQEEQTGPAPFESVFAGAAGPVRWGLGGAAGVGEPGGGCPAPGTRRDVMAPWEDATRRRYRGQVCRLARKSGMGERRRPGGSWELSRQGAGAERHVGWFLFRRPLGAEKRTRVRGRATARWSCSLPPCSPPLWLCCWTAGWGGCCSFSPCPIW